MTPQRLKQQAQGPHWSAPSHLSVWLLPLGNLFFSNETERGGGSEWEGRGGKTGGVEGGETVISIYFIIKESIFNKGENIIYKK